MDKCLQVYLLVLSVIASNVIYNALVEPLATELNFNNKQVKITTPGPLLDEAGRLIDSGYATWPVKDLNEENIPSFLGLKQLAFLRYKKWDFFSVMAGDFIFTMHFADLGYGGVVYVQLFDYTNDEIITSTETIHDLSTLPKLSPTSSRYNSTYYYKSDLIEISLKQTPFKEDKAHHFVEFNVKTDKINGNFVAKKNATEEEVVMLSKLSEDGSKFYYNTKSYGIDVNGTLEYTTSDLTQKKVSSDGVHWFLGRDIGRGVWNYRSFWFWTHGQGLAKYQDSGKPVRIGINLGYGFEDPSTGAYENSVFLRGRIIRLNSLKYEYNENDIDSPWKFYTEDSSTSEGAFSAEFFPQVQLKATDNLVVFQSKLNKVFGKFKGWVVNHEGRKVAFEEVTAFVEVHRAKW